VVSLHPYGAHTGIPVTISARMTPTPQTSILETLNKSYNSLS